MVGMNGPQTSWEWLCPRLNGAERSAAVAELSLQLGSVQAAYDHLARQRADREALAAAHRREVADALAAVAWRAAEDQAYRRWLATPLPPPEWATPDPGQAAA